MARERKGIGIEEGIFEAVDASPVKPIDPAVFFGTANPLFLDLGCGKGRFLIAQALANPTMNCLGVDRLMRRLAKLNARAKLANLANIRLIQADAYDVVTHLLPPASVTTCCAFFPDPWPKRKHHERRLFSPKFMDGMARTLMDGGALYAATDHADYFQWITRIIHGDSRFETIPPLIPGTEACSEFEIIAARNGIPVNRIGARLRTRMKG